MHASRGKEHCRELHGDLCRQHEDSDVLMWEEAKTCFDLPLCEAAAHLLVRILDSRGQRQVAVMTATLMQALTCPQTWEQGLSHFSASKAESFFNQVLASLLV
jgi:hypothetical protein